MSEEPFILSLIKKGTKEFPRYIIAKGDAVRNPIYWDNDNEVWQDDEANATIFADVNKALWVHHRLMLENLKGHPRHRYVAPIYLDMYGEKPDLEVLQDWLEKAIRIVVNTPQYGNGPKGSVGIIIADFDEIKEIT